MTMDPKKKERLAAALRENLKRRKSRDRALKGDGGITQEQFARAETDAHDSLPRKPKRTDVV
jgi:hypothetical protein